MNKIVVIIVSLIIIGVTAVAQPCPHPFKIVVIGSSTSAGSGASVPDSAYVNRYRKFLMDSVNAGCTVINLAIGGATSYKMQPTGYTPPANRSGFPTDTARNITKAISLAPDGIIINYPSNDAASGFTLQEQKDNFLRAIAKADSAGIPVWVTTTQPRNFTDTAQLNKQIAMRDWINTTYGPLHNIDFWTSIATTTGTIVPAYNSGDGVHLNNAGHRVLNDRVKVRGIHVALCAIPTHIGNTNNGPSLTIYPNPVINELTIALNTTNSDIVCNVYDIYGKRVPLAVSMQEASHKILISGFSDLAAGTYFIEVINGSETVMKLVTKAF